MNDSFSKLAAVLDPRRSVPTPTRVRVVSFVDGRVHAPGARRRSARSAPDRSRDHAAYAAPHRPPTSCAPASEETPTQRTPRRIQAPLVAAPAAAPTRPAPVALAVAVFVALGAFVFAFLACAVP